jgi:hypothetical protein
MRKYHNILFTALFCLIIAGCEDDLQETREVFGEDPILTENLDLSSFNRIESSGIANFYIAIGSPQSVTLKAETNIIDIVTHEVTDQTLKVGIEKHVLVNNYEEIRFDITVPALNYIGLHGVGDYDLSGEVQEELTIVHTGVGNIDAYDMRVDTCTITFSGIGDCRVNVISDLNVTITGLGDVYYRGNPSITSSLTGAGQLINDN